MRNKPTGATPTPTSGRRRWAVTAALTATATALLCGVGGAAFAGTPGSIPGNGTYVGGIPRPGGFNDPQVLWDVPGGLLGTCISENVGGPLHGPYTLSATIANYEYAELNYLYAKGSTSDVRLGELSILNNDAFHRAGTVSQFYLLNGDNGMSQSDADAMLAQARRLEGPYTVGITGLPQGRSADKLGKTYTGTVTVTGAHGSIPGARVALSSTGPAGLSTHVVTTGSTGRATFTLKPTSANAKFTVVGTTSEHKSVREYSHSGEQTILVGGVGTPVHGSESGYVEPSTVNAYIEKVDPTTGKALAGAVFHVTGPDFDHTFTTQATAVSTGPLTIGDTYTFDETKAPPGYYVPVNHSTTVKVTASTNVIEIGDPRTPVLSVGTQVNYQSAQVGRKLTDTVTLTGDDGENGVITGTLYGPVPANADGSAPTLAQYKAAPSQTFSTPIVGSVNKGDGSYTISGPTVTKPGVYGWAETATLTPSGATVTSPATTPRESTVVTSPTASTQVNAQATTPGDTLTDTVVVSGVGEVPASSDTVTATLYHEAYTSATSDCSTVAWAKDIAAGVAKPVFTSTKTVLVNGTYVTGGYTIPASGLGCYSWGEVEQQSGTTSPAGQVVLTTPGQVTETTAVISPSVTTKINTTQVTGSGSLHDTIVLTGTHGQAGSISGELLGPVSPNSKGTCTNVDYSKAAVAGSIAIIATKGDNSYTSSPVSVGKSGCYTFEEAFRLTSTGKTVVNTRPGLSTETALVKPSPKPTTPVTSQTSTNTGIASTSTGINAGYAGNGHSGPVLAVIGGIAAALAALAGLVLAAARRRRTRSES